MPETAPPTWFTTPTWFIEQSAPQTIGPASQFRFLLPNWVAMRASELEALRALVNAGAIIVVGARNLAELSEADKNAARGIVQQLG